HTRSYGDWSSDVCSSDLHQGAPRRRELVQQLDVLLVIDVFVSWRGHGYRKVDGAWTTVLGGGCTYHLLYGAIGISNHSVAPCPRSEERRVGKEGRSRWAQ